MERELWKIISRLITQLDRTIDQGARVHSVGRIVRFYLWSALHDRPVYWACDRGNWAGVRPPTQWPDQSTLSRRLRCPQTRWMLDQLMLRLEPWDRARLLRCVDGKPLTVSRHSVDRQAAFGRGAGGMDRGYKLHAIYADHSRPVAWAVTPLNRCEHHVAAQLIDERSEPGYLLADAAYDANSLHEQASRHDIRLLTPRRYQKARGLGHHRHSDHRRDALNRLAAPSPFVRQLLLKRRRIETHFAHLTNFGGGLTCLPSWVRGLLRVELWVAAKIIVRLARNQRRNDMRA